MKKCTIRLTFVMLALLAGCHETKTPQTVTSSGQAANASALSTGPSTIDELNNPNSPLAKRSIYFDFDSYTVRDDYQALLQAHADYLRRHPSQHVLIQGNTDERGTTELQSRPGRAALAGRHA
ncbi:outer membrane protein OmpA-like peptidoglycan-associated protein [Paraburkholderia sp. RAU6.4a]